MRRQVFIGWTIALTVLWLFMNWPTTSGLGQFWAHAGFPLVFSWGTSGRFQNFDALALAVDVLLGMTVIVGLSWLCAWSRK
jgi:hypothetical protein